MALAESFFLTKDPAVVEEFTTSGYIIRDVEDRAALDEMRHELVALDLPIRVDSAAFRA